MEFLSETILLFEAGDSFFGILLIQIAPQLVKKSFKDFASFYRVEDAKEILIQNHTLNSSVVAFEVGFNSVSAFYKNFRNITGYTPDQFRKKFSGAPYHPVENEGIVELQK
ncbi:MAG: helix-turn-helix domain-containing protein [Spirochaetia bacterium]|nr:helix-turn-helix domain-containing protein [Spirochaetia bacterium]